MRDGLHDGFKDVGPTLGVNRQFTEHWFTGASATDERLVGDAGSSPVVRTSGSKNRGFGGACAGYRL